MIRYFKGNLALNANMRLGIFLILVVGSFLNASTTAFSDSNIMINREKAFDSALHGLDFLVRHQMVDKKSADYGRFPGIFDCKKLEIQDYTINWTTGVCVEVLLIGHKATGKQEYLDAAERGIKYISSLQYFGPENEKMYGVIREQTPQTSWVHPRDALTAAWAMLDFSQYTGQEKYLQRSILYANWFIQVGLEQGYPYWLVHLDDKPWLPKWFGSFQSGGAFYFYRLYSVTGDRNYKNAMFQILDHYNTYHLEEDGRIHVTVDIESRKPIQAYQVNPRFSKEGWEIMHEYNDDFGALANLAGYKISNDKKYLFAAESFLKRMVSIQRKDGGFGPEEYSIPCAGGLILLTLLAAQKLGISIATDQQIDQAVQYILELQVQDPQSPAYGAFYGFDEKYKISKMANARTIAYSVMGLFRYAGVADPFYYFDL